MIRAFLLLSCAVPRPGRGLFDRPLFRGVRWLPVLEMLGTKPRPCARWRCDCVSVPPATSLGRVAAASLVFTETTCWCPRHTGRHWAPSLRLFLASCVCSGLRVAAMPAQ